MAHTVATTALPVRTGKADAAESFLLELGVEIQGRSDQFTTAAPPVRRLTPSPPPVCMIPEIRLDAGGEKRKAAQML